MEESSKNSGYKKRLNELDSAYLGDSCKEGNDKQSHCSVSESGADHSVAQCKRQDNIKPHSESVSGSASSRSRRKKNFHKPPKLCIGLARRFVREHNQAIEKMLTDVQQHLKKCARHSTNKLIKSVAEKIRDSGVAERVWVVPPRQGQVAEVSAAYWLKGPPPYELPSADIDLEEQEESCMTLWVVGLGVSRRGIGLLRHCTGIMVSLHAMARMIQRLGTDQGDDHRLLRQQLEPLITWSSLYSAMPIGGKEAVGQMVVPSDSGAWLGTSCLAKDKEREGRAAPAFFIRTFLGDRILHDNQKDRHQGLLSSMDSIGKYRYQMEWDYLRMGKPPAIDKVDAPISEAISSKIDFFSRDRFVARMEESDFNAFQSELVSLSQGVDDMEWYLRGFQQFPIDCPQTYKSADKAASKAANQ